MSLAVKRVGAEDLPQMVLGDPNLAGQFPSVISVADALNLAGKFALLVQGVPLLLNAGGNVDQQRAAPGTTGIPAVNVEGTKATYSCAISGFTPAATPTDIWALVGSATRVVRLLRLVITGMATAADSRDIQLIKRTTDNTGGTIVNPAIPLHDSNDGAVTAVLRQYTANPSGLGTSVGVARAERLNLGAAGAAGRIPWDFATRASKGLVLRGTSQLYVLNWAGASVPAGTVLSIDAEWTEEA
jgi:hypothetical protein